jgi:hypothetical protein
MKVVPVQVCCSSPERFLRGGRGKTVEAKPIKGTARRNLEDAVADAAAAAALEASEKVGPSTHVGVLLVLHILRHCISSVSPVLGTAAWLPSAYVGIECAGSSREPDDCGPASERPGAGLPGWHSARTCADAGGELCDRPPARQYGQGPSPSSALSLLLCDCS